MSHRHDPNGPATPAQRERAQRLGITIPPDATLHQAGQILDAAPPSKEQLALALALGIRAAERMNAGKLSRALTEASIRIGRLALRNNPALCEGKVIVYNSEAFTVERIWNNPRKPSVTLRPVAGGRAKVVSAALLVDAIEVKLPKR